MSEPDLNKAPQVNTLLADEPISQPGSLVLPPPVVTSAQRVRSAGLGCITLVAIFFVAVTAFGGAYQTRPSYKIDLGNRLDRPFVSGFSEREPGQPQRESTVTPWDGTDYRWSLGEGHVDIPGLGSQPLTVTLRFTAASNPTSTLTVIINDKNQVAISPSPLPVSQWIEASFLVPANWFPDGHLHLKLKSNTFKPEGDVRTLGLNFDWIKVEPAQLETVNFIRPPDGEYLPLVFTAVLAVLIFIAIGLPTAGALAGGCAVVGAFAYWLINDRLSLTTLIERDFIRIMFFLWVVVYLAAEYGPRLYRWLGLPTTRAEGGWLAGFALLQFVLLYFFQLHPQFASSDVGLSINHLYKVRAGQLVFTSPLPTGQPAPYPPVFYLFLLPFTGLSGESRVAIENLIVLANSALAASGVFLVYYLASLVRPSAWQSDVRKSRNTRPFLTTNPAAVIAAGFYAINRYQFLIFSQGNHANLFGAWAFLLFLAVVVGTLHYLRRLARSQSALALAERQILPARPLKSVEISHAVSQPPADPDLPPGSPYADLEGLEGVLKLENGRRRSPKVNSRLVSRTLAGWWRPLWPRLEVAGRYLLPLALLLVVLLSHYGTFLFANVFMLVYIVILLGLGSRAARPEGAYLLFCWVCALVLAILLYYHNFFDLIGNFLSGAPVPEGKVAPPFDLSKAFRRTYSDLRDYFGLVVLIAAGGGIALWLVGRLQTARAKGFPAWRIGPVGGAILALGLTGLGFALAEAVRGLETRYQLYFITFVAIAAGSFLGRVWRSGWAGQMLVAGLFGFQLLGAILFWLDRVTYY